MLLFLYLFFDIYNIPNLNQVRDKLQLDICNPMVNSDCYSLYEVMTKLNNNKNNNGDNKNTGDNKNK